MEQLPNVRHCTLASVEALNQDLQFMARVKGVSFTLLFNAPGICILCRLYFNTSFLSGFGLAHCNVKVVVCRFILLLSWLARGTRESISAISRMLSVNEGMLVSFSSHLRAGLSSTMPLKCFEIEAMI